MCNATERIRSVAQRERRNLRMNAIEKLIVAVLAVLLWGVILTLTAFKGPWDPPTLLLAPVVATTASYFIVRGRGGRGSRSRNG
jgi:uncharacterized membrane protein